jgi:hypothetical protein
MHEEIWKTETRIDQYYISVTAKALIPTDKIDFGVRNISLI